MVEEGGKALAAYFKPREDGTVKAEPADEIADVVKTSGMWPNTGSPTRSAPSRCRLTSARRISTCGPRQ